MAVHMHVQYSCMHEEVLVSVYHFIIILYSNSIKKYKKFESF